MKNTRYPNIVELEVTGDYALFSDPVMRVGGEKTTMQIPTYEALKGILSSVYWKPTFIWYIDAVRIMNRIQTEVKGIRPIKYSGGNDLSYYTYLKNCRYRVRAHFEWNENHEIAKKMIRKGGRRDIFLGSRECQGYVEPCVFEEGTGAYDDLEELGFGLMYHGITYADEAYSEETKGRMTVNLWRPVMRKGVITYLRPEECPVHKTVREMEIKPFGQEYENFRGIGEFEEVK